MYEFFSSGFFGYGEPGNFKYYSFAHLIPLLVLLFAIILTYFKQDKIRKWIYEERARFIFSFIMMLVEMSFFGAYYMLEMN